MTSILCEAPPDPLAIPEQKAIVDRIIQGAGGAPGAAMVVLNDLQSQIGYVSLPMQEYVARKLRVPRSQIHGVVSFYSFFTTKPRGTHTVKLCLGTACYVGGVTKLIDKAQQLLGVRVGETTEDWRITLESCRCVGACSQAPIVTVDGDVYGRVRPEQLPEILTRYA
ncbi:MAG TPA: NAD(P)H-dependent oxidoreductase subunit E [Candidatus Acidoferrum sp.]|nr:NAD(P)H-dependent oxidoreductase subunit E [Candidatus Acidoferrum sp.]